MTALGPEVETVDPHHGLVIRRVIVGPLSTNCYLLHASGSRDALLIDPGGDAPTILDAAHDLHVSAIVVTHTHWDHVEALAEVLDALGAPVVGHAADRPVWPHELNHLAHRRHWDAGTATLGLLAAGCPPRPPPGAQLWDGRLDRLTRHGDIVATTGLGVRVIHTPGHTPGGISLALSGHVLTGDTLFPGGPGLTGWPLSDFDTIIESVRHRLLTLPPDTVVHPGHGPATTIGAERPHLASWIRRGW